MAKPGITGVRGRKPVTRKISGKSIVLAIDGGPEPPYPFYQFSRRQFFQRPKHNPFSGL